MSDKNNLKIPFWFIITLLFVEGFVGLSYQMLYIRQMVPVIGSNIIIVSWIVGMFLLFLAIGYRQGGRFSGNVKNKLAKRGMVEILITSNKEKKNIINITRKNEIVSLTDICFKKFLL